MDDRDDGALNVYEDGMWDAVTTLKMADESGKETEFIIISSVSVDDENFLLVTENGRLGGKADGCGDADIDEIDAVILKEACVEGEDSVFIVVDDDEEFLKAVELFKNSSDDYDIEV